VRVFVTGATGFVGTHLVGRLADRHAVVCAVRPGHAAPGPAGTERFEVDLATYRSDQGLPSGVEAILHLAQAPPGSDDATLFATNTASTLALADAARRAGVARFVLASSGSVYRKAFAPVDETAAVEPDSVYGATKLAAETLLLPYRDSLDVGILRLFAPYGPGQVGRLIPRLIESVESGQPVLLSSGGQLTVNPIYIDDLVDILVRAVDVAGSYLVNVAGPDMVTIADIATLAAQKLGRSAVLSEVERPPDGWLVATTDRMRAMFPESGMTPFDVGLGRTLQATRTA
jgi:UDP-glucose 4-epimerase